MKQKSNRSNLFESIIKDLKAEIPQNMKEQHIPGLAMALVSKEKTIWVEGFGYTDKTKTQAVNTDTLFSLQSTTKTVTTVAFLLAVQQGLVKLDDPIINYYPEFTVNSRFGKDQVNKITFRHLLSHRSGLTNEPKLGGCFDHSLCTWEEHIQSISGSWLLFPVGTRYNYSNAGMDLVAYLLEKITGTSYPEYVQKVLGDPLGIRFYYTVKEIYAQPNAAKGHLGDFEAASTDDLGLGCGVAYLSIKDLARFTRFLVNLGTFDNKQILKADYVKSMCKTDMDGGYGLGTFVYRDLGTSLPNHAGGGFGLACEMFWLPDYDIGVTAFANQEYQEYLKSLVKKPLKRILEFEGVSFESTTFPYSGFSQKEIDIHLLDRLVGLYSGPPAWIPSLVTLKEGKLFLGPRELIPLGETIFKGENVKEVIFQLNNENKPISLKRYTDGWGVIDMNYFGRPSTQPGPNNPEWKHYEGLYRFSFYRTEAYYDALKLEDDGYLHLASGQCLYDDKNSPPNVLFTAAGEAVTLEEDHVYIGNIKGKKINDPVTDLTKLADQNSNHRYLQGWLLDQVVNQLKYLGRAEEAENISQLKERLS
ncbi:MAG: serine hydrolase domain-containing protein [Candidatus Hermodarchaeota archaeon]